MRSIILMLLLCCFSIVSSTAQTLEERYRQFQQQAKQSYTDFRDAANRQYAEFLRAAWEYYQAAPAVPRPKEEQVPPVIYDEEQDRRQREQQQNQQQEEQLADNDIPTPRDDEKAINDDNDIITIPDTSPQPQPISPIIEHNKGKDNEQRLSVSFYGTDISVRYPSEELTLNSTQPAALAAAWEQLSSDKFNNLLLDCLTAREQLHLCDWAYLSMLQTIAEQTCGKTDAAVFLQAFLYAQSGYQMRLAQDKQGKLYMLIGSRYVFYDRGYFQLDEGNFFPLTDISAIADGLHICNGAFPKEQSLSLQIEQEQLLTYQPSPLITRTAQSGLSAKVCVNRNLIDFYNHYPTGHYGDDFSTRWALYANTPLDENIRKQLYPALRSAITGKTELQAVNLLLNWVQTAFEYEYDDVVWGGRPCFLCCRVTVLSLLRLRRPQHPLLTTNKRPARLRCSPALLSRTSCHCCSLHPTHTRRLSHHRQQPFHHLRPDLHRCPCRQNHAGNG